MDWGGGFGWVRLRNEVRTRLLYHFYLINDAPYQFLEEVIVYA